MKKLLLIGGIIVLGAIGFLMYRQFAPKSSSVPASEITTGGYTLSQVATHNTSSSCWAAVNGKVYDLTNWINKHPGGADKILGICGTDATAAFEAQHSGQDEPAEELANFEIGSLTQ